MQLFGLQVFSGSLLGTSHGDTMVNGAAFSYHGSSSRWVTFTLKIRRQICIGAPSMLGTLIGINLLLKQISKREPSKQATVMWPLLSESGRQMGFWVLEIAKNGELPNLGSHWKARKFLTANLWWSFKSFIRTAADSSTNFNRFFKLLTDASLRSNLSLNRLF